MKKLNPLTTSEYKKERAIAVLARHIQRKYNCNIHDARRRAQNMLNIA